MVGGIVRLEFRAQRGTIHFRHHDIRDDQVGHLFQYRCETLLSVLASCDVIVVGERLCQVVANLAIVLNDNHFLAFAHLRQFGAGHLLFLRQLLFLRDDALWGLFCFLLLGDYLLSRQVFVA